ncbi:MAG: methyltransferase [Solirubrobacterales bacterium]|nr:methyltransferase [Solirubrobacterales bacterium]MBV9713960.1 methyltransferase [Solirubrobacterales bacterium]
MGLRLLPLPGVFQPRSDSVMLARRIPEEPLRAGATVLDLCTGSGILAVTAALAGASRVVAVDVARLAVLAARLNARLNGVRVRAVRGDLFRPVAGECFDLIVSNPPYLPGPAGELPERGAARAWEGGPHGRAFIDRICDQARSHLRPGGALLLLQSSVCDVDETLARLTGQGLEAGIVFIHRGPLGPVLSNRVEWLREQGGLDENDHEEVVIIRAARPSEEGARR